MKRNLNTLKRLISGFSGSNKNALSKEERFKMLDEILFFENNKKKDTEFLNRETGEITLHDARCTEIHGANRHYTPGTTFIRARKVKDVLNNPVLQDFWEPPAELTKKYRLNQPGEAMLYVTCDTFTAILETKVKPNDIYNLSFYRVNEEIQVTEFGFSSNRKQTDIEKAIEVFLHNLLKKPGANAYDISNFIARRYLSLAEDGWVYPSVANSHFLGVNLCLNTKAKSKLSLIGSFSFCNDTPIANYDITDHSAIKIVQQSEAVKLWDEFTKKPGIFGETTARHNPHTLSFVRLIPEL